MVIVDNKEDGFTKEVSEYPCSGFILDISFLMNWMMLVAKYAYLGKCNQGIMAKYSNSECRCSITMTMMHN